MSRENDLTALRRLVEAYAAGADRRDATGVAALFVEGAELEVWMDPAVTERTGVRHGSDEIGAAIASLARYHTTHHTVSTLHAVVDGDRAAGETRCVAHHVEPEGAGWHDRVLFLRYADDFARTDAGWRFARRELHVEFIEIHPVHQ